MNNTTATTRKSNKDGVTQAFISAYMLEDLLQSVIEISNDGYEIVKGSTVSYGQIKSVVMSKTEEAPSEGTLIVTEENDDGSFIEDDSDKLDRDYLTSIEGNKKKLELYGRKIGIELKKSKSYANMLIDLEDYAKTL